MYEVMQRYEKITIKEAMHKDHMQTIQLLLVKGCSKDFILSSNFTEDEHNEVEGEFLSEKQN